MAKLKRFGGGYAKSGKKLDKQIKRIYNLNKERIDAGIIQPQGDRRRKSTIFKRQIKSYMEEDGLTLNQAITKYERSRLITSKAEMYKENVIEAMRKQEKLEEFRRRRGWKDKFDINKLEYIKRDKEGKREIYRYDGRVMIYINDSPEEDTGATIEFGWELPFING